jgi:16S rRNA (uracil1498-N3)-methyltransferase
LPTVERPVQLLSYLGELSAAAYPRWVLEPHTTPARREHASLCAADIAIGPEGGFAADEIEAFVLAGFLPLGLGPRVLRTETAAIAAIVWLQTLFGDMS